MPQRERLVPGTLTRERILDVALLISARDGIDALSMRKIAAELGTSAMSLYNHVPDKAALLRGLADRVLAEVELRPSTEWRTIARHWATSLRATLLTHRFVVAIMLSVNDLRPLVESRNALVAALADAGLDNDHAQRVMRVLGRFVAGSVLLDAAYLTRDPAERETLDHTFHLGVAAVLDGIAIQVDHERDTDAAPADLALADDLAAADDGSEHGVDPAGSTDALGA